MGLSVGCHVPFWGGGGLWQGVWGGGFVSHCGDWEGFGGGGCSHAPPTATGSAPSRAGPHDTAATYWLFSL